MSVDDWGRYEKFVVGQLSQLVADQQGLVSDQKDQSKQLKSIEIEIAKIKAVAGIFGFLAGSIPVLMGIVYQVLKLMLEK